MRAKSDINPNQRDVLHPGITNISFGLDDNDNSVSKSSSLAPRISTSLLTPSSVKNFHSVTDDANDEKIIVDEFKKSLLSSKTEPNLIKHFLDEVYEQNNIIKDKDKAIATARASEEVSRIIDRAKITPSDRRHLIQSAMRLDPAKLARQRVKENKELLLEAEHGSFLTGMIMRNSPNIIPRESPRSSPRPSMA